jgi:2-polyprenyl-3-methyl-5-hydroxy-6-metoxy-1,4-benzoquinol methylase
MMKYIPSTSQKILDVGCGQGLFGRQLKDKLGAEVWGIELDKKSALIAEHNIDKIINDDIYHAIGCIPDKHFDCVVFNDVLEHLVDPYSILIRIKEKMSQSGVLVCSIPNVRYFFNLRELLRDGQWKYTDYGIMDRTHLRFFTLNSIRDMFDELGYEEILIEGINPITSWKFKLLNAFTLGYLSDTRYWRFACVERPRS